MVGLKFILTAVQFIVAVVIGAAAVTGLFYGATALFRLMWDVFERTYEDQARWLLSKFHPLRAYKGCLIPFVAIAMTIAIGLFIFLLAMSGNGAQGQPIP